MIYANEVFLGSSLQFLRILQNPRWEDYEYEYDDAAKGNFLYFMGNGMTVTELDKTGNREYYVDFDLRLWDAHELFPSGVWYLDDDYVDVPPSTYSR